MSALAAAVVLAQTGNPRPQDLISKMLALYAGAQSLKGTITAEVNAVNQKVTVATRLQYDRPGRRLFIEQVQSFKGQSVYRVISDGNGFLYTNPIDHLRSRQPFLVEKASREESDPLNPTRRTRVNLSLAEIYGASTQGLADRSVPLDVAIARTTDLQYFVGQLATMANKGAVEFRGRKAFHIAGEWRPFADAAKNMGSFDLFVTGNGDLVGYRITEQFQVQGKVVPMVSTWEAKFEVGAKVDPALFKLRT